MGRSKKDSSMLETEMNRDALYRMPLREARQAFEREYFKLHLEEKNWNLKETARLAGISERLLYLKISQYGLRRFSVKDADLARRQNVW